MRRDPTALEAGARARLLLQIEQLEAGPVSVRDFAFPKTDPRHWGIPLPQEDTPPSSSLGSSSPDDDDDDDEDETPLEKATGETADVDLWEASEPPSGAADDDGAPSSTGWLTGDATGEPSGDAALEWDQRALEQLSLSDGEPSNAALDVFSRLSVELLDVLSYALNVRATPAAPQLPQRICFSRAVAQYEFRKMTDWEMTIHEGDHLIIAAPFLGAAPPSDQTGEKRAAPAPKPASTDREASIDDLSEVDSCRQRKIRSLQSMGSLLDVLYGPQGEGAADAPPGSPLDAAQLGLARDPMTLSPLKSDVARSYEAAAQASPAEKLGRGRSLDQLLPEPSDSAPVSPAATSPSPIVPQRRSSLASGKSPTKASASFGDDDSVLLASVVSAGPPLRVAKDDLAALALHARLYWDVRVAQSRPEKLRRHLVEYLEYQKEYGDGWLTALRVSFKWCVSRGPVPREFNVRVKMRVSEVGLVPGNYVV